MEGRFDPLASVDKYTWKLSKGQARHVNKYFMEYLPDCVMKKSITRKAPCPGDKILTAPKLDEHIVQLLPPVAHTPTRAVDSSFKHIHTCMLDAMGPLGVSWNKLSPKLGITAIIAISHTTTGCELEISLTKILQS